MPTGADRAEAAFWATYLRNRNVDVATAHDGAVAVAGGYAVCARATTRPVAFAVGSSRPLTDDDVAVLDAFYRSRGVPVRVEMRETAIERDRALLDRHGFALEDERSRSTKRLARRTATSPGAGIAVRLERDRASWVRLCARVRGGRRAGSGRSFEELCAAAAAACSSPRPTAWPPAAARSEFRASSRSCTAAAFCRTSAARSPSGAPARAHRGRARARITRATTKVLRGTPGALRSPPGSSGC